MTNLPHSPRLPSHPASGQKHSRVVLPWILWMWSICLLISTLSHATAAPSAQNSASGGPFQVLLVGDSLSAAYGIPQKDSWVQAVTQELQTVYPPLTLVNASISGETTGGGKFRINDLLAKHSPDLLIIELGGNDGLRGFPIEVIRDNLTYMVTAATRQEISVLLIGMHIPPNYGPGYTESFHEVFHKVSEQHAIPLIPFLLEDVALHPELMQRDGIHPNAAAQPAIAEHVLETLVPLVEELTRTQRSEYPQASE